METYQAHVVKEQYDLNVKISALEAFITGVGSMYSKLSDEERVQLREQLAYMKKYNEILIERIAAWKLD